MTDVDNQRVEMTYERYETARRQRDAFWVEHADVLERYQELCEHANMQLKKFEQACRETRQGTGPVTVRVTNLPVFNVEFLEELLQGEDDIRNELILTVKKVKPSVFDRLASEGYLGKHDIARAIDRIDHKVSLYGLPKPTVLP